MTIQTAQCHQDAKSELATWSFEHSFTQSSKKTNCIGLAVPGFHCHFGLHKNSQVLVQVCLSDILESFHRLPTLPIFDSIQQVIETLASPISVKGKQLRMTLRRMSLIR